MKIYQSIFNRGKKGGDTGRIGNTWTLRLTHTDDYGDSTSKTWQYATKQDAKDDIENRKAELIGYVESKGRDLGDIKTFKQWAEYAKADFYRAAVIKEGQLWLHVFTARSVPEALREWAIWLKTQSLPCLEAATCGFRGF